MAITKIKKKSGEGYKIRPSINLPDGSVIQKSKNWYPAKRMTPKKMEKEAWRIHDEWKKELEEYYRLHPEAINQDETPLKHSVSAEQQQHTAGNIITFEEYYRNSFLNRPSLKNSTKEIYMVTEKMFMEFIGDKPIAEITRNDVQEFINHLQQQGYAANTIQMRYRDINGAFKRAIRDGVCKNNPAQYIDRPKVRNGDVEALNDAEVSTLLRNLDQEPVSFQVFVLVCLMCGTRRGECLGLKWEDVDFATKRLSVRRSVAPAKGGGGEVTNLKTEQSKRILPIPQNVLEVFQKLYEESGSPSQDAYVFPSHKNENQPLNPGSYTLRVQSYCERIGLKRYSPHDLRHTYGTMLNRNKVDPKTIQALLGHANIATTYMYYVGVDLELAATEVERLASRVFGGIVR